LAGPSGPEAEHDPDGAGSAVRVPMVTRCRWPFVNCQRGQIRLRFGQLDTCCESEFEPLEAHVGSGLMSYWDCETEAGGRIDGA